MHKQLLPFQESVSQYPSQQVAYVCPVPGRGLQAGDGAPAARGGSVQTRDILGLPGGKWLSHRSLSPKPTRALPAAGFPSLSVTAAARGPFLASHDTGRPPASGTLTLMWPPSYSYGYRQSMITNSLMRLANLPFRTDAICGERPGESVLAARSNENPTVPMRQFQKHGLQFLERCTLDPDASRRPCGRGSP